MKIGRQVPVTCYLFLARTLMLENKQDGAIATLRTGLKFKPGITVARRDLAAALFFTGRCREAETELETGPAHDATEPDLHCPPAMGAAMQGQYLRARQQCAEAQRLAPDFPLRPRRVGGDSRRAAQGGWGDLRVPQGPQTPARPPRRLNNLGWVLATSGNPSSATMAACACELTRNREASATFAPAYAEAGRIDQAVSRAPRAHDAAVAHGDTNAALRDLEPERIYRGRKPFYDRDPALPFGVLAPPFHSIP